MVSLRLVETVKRLFRGKLLSPTTESRWSGELIGRVQWHPNRPHFTRITSVNSCWRWLQRMTRAVFISTWKTVSSFFQVKGCVCGWWRVVVVFSEVDSWEIKIWYYFSSSRKLFQIVWYLKKSENCCVVGSRSPFSLFASATIWWPRFPSSATRLSHTHPPMAPYCSTLERGFFVEQGWK